MLHKSVLREQRQSAVSGVEYAVTEPRRRIIPGNVSRKIPRDLDAAARRMEVTKARRRKKELQLVRELRGLSEIEEREYARVCNTLQRPNQQGTTR